MSSPLAKTCSLKVQNLGSVEVDALALIHSGSALPTEVQVIALAEVTGINRHDLQDDIALLRATPEQLPMLKRVM